MKCPWGNPGPLGDLRYGLSKEQMWGASHLPPNDRGQDPSAAAVAEPAPGVVGEAKADGALSPANHLMAGTPEAPAQVSWPRPRPRPP